jgi:hypothetical protein
VGLHKIGFYGPFIMTSKSVGYCVVGPILWMTFDVRGEF